MKENGRQLETLCGISEVRAVVLAAALVLTGSADLFGQEAPPVAPGDRVRIAAPEIVNDRVVGTVVALKPDTLAVNVENRDSPLALPLASLTKLEVSQGQKSRTLKGAGIGFLVGGAAGLATAALACAIAGDCDADDPYTGLVYAVFGVLGAGVGTLTGAIIGSTIKVDRWDTVQLDQLRVGLPPRGHGLEVSAKFVF